MKIEAKGPSGMIDLGDCPFIECPHCDSDVDCHTWIGETTCSHA